MLWFVLFRSIKVFDLNVSVLFSLEKESFICSVNGVPYNGFFNCLFNFLV